MAMKIGVAEVTQLVETIWSSVLEWDVRPVEDVAEPAAAFVTGTVRITGAWTGSVHLRCDREVTTAAAARMFELPANQLSTDMVLDALGELTNMLAGNLKGLLPGPCELGLPTVGDDWDASLSGRQQAWQTAFRCDRGLLLVEIRECQPSAEGGRLVTAA